MVDILVTNDDGYKSVGLSALTKALSTEFSVTVVAPDGEKSWIGKSVSKVTPLTLKKKKSHGEIMNVVSGTPADCVQIGVFHVLNEKPAFVVSGINLDHNSGHGFILSSGTVGAAMEASIIGVRAIATSMQASPGLKKKLDFSDSKNQHLFDEAAKITLKVVKLIENKKFDEQVDLISINIPFGATIDSKMEVTVPLRTQYGQLFHKKGKVYVHVNPNHCPVNPKKGTDYHAISKGIISITPICLDLVSRDAVSKFRKEMQIAWNK